MKNSVLLSAIQKINSSLSAKDFRQEIKKTSNIVLKDTHLEETFESAVMSMLERIEDREVSEESTLEIAGMTYLQKHNNKIAESSLKAKDLYTCQKIEFDDLSQAPAFIKATPGFYVVDSEMGAGKTRDVAIPLAKGKYSVMLIPFKTLVPKYFKGTSADYMQKTEKRTSLVTVFNSIIRKDLKQNIENIEILIIEEAAGIFSQMTSDACGRNHEEKELIISTLQRMIGTARTVVITDATLTEDALNFFTKARGIKNAEVKKISTRYRKVAKKTVLMSRTKGEIIAAAAEDISAGKKVAVFTDCSVSKGHQALKIAIKQLAQAKIASFTANTKETLEEVISKNDLIIISPAVVSGVSITNNEVKSVFGMFNGTISTQAITQMTNRFREVDEVKIYAKNCQAFSSELMIFAKILSGSEIDLSADLNALKNSKVVKLCIEQRMKKQRLNENLEQSLTYALQSVGTKVIRLKTAGDKKTEGVTASRESEKLEKESRKFEILKADSMKTSEFSSLLKKKCQTREEFIKTERFSIEKVYKTSSDEELGKAIEIDGFGKGRKLLKLNREIRSKHAKSNMAKVIKEILKVLKVDASLKGYFDGYMAGKALRVAQRGSIKINGIRIKISDVLREERLLRCIGIKATGETFLKVIMMVAGIEIEKSCGKMKLKTDTPYLIELNSIARIKMIGNIESKYALCA